MAKTDQKFKASRAIVRAVKTAKTHISVQECSEPILNEENNIQSIRLCIRVNLANSCRAKGVSPTGVREYESVRVDFPPEYPYKSPEFSLRKDFSRDNAHIQPWLTADGCPVPCLVDGLIDETFVREGFIGLLNRIAKWLDKAADGSLINFSQGWEPTRRDHLRDVFVYDAGHLREHIRSEAGHSFYSFFYIKHKTAKSTDWCVGDISYERLNLESLPADYYLEENTNDVFRGRGLAILLWPNENFLADIYKSENVINIKTLKERAEFYGCADQLFTAFLRLEQWLSNVDLTEQLTISLLLCSRRPCNLINEDSTIEISPYLLPNFTSTSWKSNETEVRAAGHRSKISPDILKLSSGACVGEVSKNWALLGAGSLGSKVALHCSRSGMAPHIIVDKNIMNPHNAARHALIPAHELSWMDGKATLLQSAVSGLAQSARAYKVNICDIFSKKEAVIEPSFLEENYIVNTTASFAVREVLSSVSPEKMSCPLVDLSIYGAGKIALIAIEGRDRNPRIGDLISEFYYEAMLDEEARSYIFEMDSESERLIIGEGCGSMTFQISDARISLFAAGMSKVLMDKLETSTEPENGELQIGKITNNGHGLSWSRFEIPKITNVEPDNSSAWEIRLHQRASYKISEDVLKWDKVETGGILIGRISEISETINIVDVLPAPQDSLRSKNEFILGTDGVQSAIDEIVKCSNGALYCVGTWHSHLFETGPSLQDKQTAKVISLSRCVPSVLLINTPNNYRALIAETNHV